MWQLLRFPPSKDWLPCCDCLQPQQDQVQQTEGEMKTHKYYSNFHSRVLWPKIALEMFPTTANLEDCWRNVVALKQEWDILLALLFNFSNTSSSIYPAYQFGQKDNLAKKTYQKRERKERRSARAALCPKVLTLKTSSSSNTWVFLRDVKLASFNLFNISHFQAVRLEVGHQFEDMIAKCTFRGRNCTDQKYVFNLSKMAQIVDRNFLAISTATYGNCFTFNSW